MLTYCYNCKGFLTSFQTEETTKNPNMKQLKKVFAHFVKNDDSSIKTENYVFFFDTKNDLENAVVTVRYYDNYNSYTESKMSVSKARKMLYSMFKNEEENSNV